MNPNKLAVLINQYGDIYNVADELNTSASAIEKAINGESLTRLESANLDEAFARFEKKAIRGKNDYDLDALDYFEAQLSDVIESLDDFESGDLFRKIFTERAKKKYRRNYTDENGDKKYKYLNKKVPKVTLEDLTELDLLFNNGYATLAIQNRLIEWLGEGEHKAETFIKYFKKDGYRLDNIKDSAFWAWFRETFYE